MSWTKFKQQLLRQWLLVVIFSSFSEYLLYCDDVCTLFGILSLLEHGQLNTDSNIITNTKLPDRAVEVLFILYYSWTFTAKRCREYLVFLFSKMSTLISAHHIMKTIRTSGRLRLAVLLCSLTHLNKTLSLCCLCVPSCNSFFYCSIFSFWMYT